VLPNKPVETVPVVRHNGQLLPDPQPPLRNNSTLSHVVPGSRGAEIHGRHSFEVYEEGHRSVHKGQNGTSSLAGGSSAGGLSAFRSASTTAGISFIWKVSPFCPGPTSPVWSV